MSGTVTTWRFPRGGNYSLLSYVFLAYLALGNGIQPANFPVRSTHPIFQPAQSMISFVGVENFKFGAFVVYPATHVLESIYTAYLCVTHGVPTGTTVRVIPSLPNTLPISVIFQLKYILSTVILGFPVWMDLKRRFAQKSA
jgi:hypothetical protein